MKQKKTPHILWNIYHTLSLLLFDLGWEERAENKEVGGMTKTLINLLASASCSPLIYRLILPLI